MNKTKKKFIGKSKYTRKKRIFKKNDFKNGDGMLTTVWGPSLWHYLHTLSFNYPLHPTPDQKKAHKEQILLLQKTLPCSHCRKNLKANLKICPLKNSHFKNRDTFSRYVYQLHETINKMLGKHSNLTYCDVRERYEHFRSRCLKENKPNNREKIEIGCTEPLYGKKAKCVLQIVPHDFKGDTFNIHKKCEINR